MNAESDVANVTNVVKNSNDMDQETIQKLLDSANANALSDRCVSKIDRYYVIDTMLMILCSIIINNVCSIFLCVQFVHFIESRSGRYPESAR